MFKLDKINRKILQELDLNARQPISQIATKCKISRDVAAYRIQKLEEQNVIKGYNTLIDLSVLGFHMYRVYLKFYAINQDIFTKILNLLHNNKNVFWVGETDGFVDLVFGIWSKSVEEFDQFYSKVTSLCRSVLKREYVHRLLEYSYCNRAYLTNTKKRVEVKIGAGVFTKHDTIDLTILRLLSNNARISVLEIAKHVKLDSSSVIHRLKILQKKGIILGYKVDLDLQVLQRSFYTIKMYLGNLAKKRQIETYLKTLPYTVNFSKALASWDIEVDLEVASNQEYHDIIRDLKSRFDEILEISFFRAIKIYKSAKMIG